MSNLLTKTANETVYLSTLEKINKDSLYKLWLHPKFVSWASEEGDYSKQKEGSSFHIDLMHLWSNTDEMPAV